MREISKFQMNVSVVTENLKARSKMEKPETEAEKIYRKFEDTRQEPVRLAAALFGFFMENSVSMKQREVYALYLKKHIRNTIEALIEEDDPQKIQYLENLGWFGKKELDGFIESAMQRKKMQSLICLMRIKDQKYGYPEEKFDL